MQNYSDNNNKPQIEPIRAIVWLRTIWTNKKILFISVILSIIIGILQIILTPPEYVAWTTIVPQTSNPSQKLGGISSLAAMAGFNLDLSGGDELSPAIYPQILGSVLFQRELMYKDFDIKEYNQSINLYTYYNEQRHKNILQRSLTKFKSFISEITGTQINEIIDKEKTNSPVLLSLKEDVVCKNLAKSIILNVDIKNGYITLFSSSTNAQLSAEVAEFARELLQKYITEFKIKKADNQLKFITERYNEKKQDYLQAQQNLARYRDRNRNISTALAATEEELLRGEYTILLSVYNELSKQLEQAELRVKEDTPVFSVIQPTKVPIEKTKPKKAFLMIIWLFIGFILGVGLIFGKVFLNKYRESFYQVQNA